MKALIIAVVLTAMADAAQAAEAFRLSSADIPANGKIANDQVFNSFGCSGKNLSPALTWSGVPEGTKSLALTVYDPDAPTGSGWWHWVVINIPPTATGLPRDAGAAASKTLPTGSRQVRTDFGAAQYGGPCPPKGDSPHRYIFTLYALSTAKIDLPADATAANAGFNIHSNLIGQARLTGTYGR